MTRILRVVVVPMAALTILVSSAVPANAASLTGTISKVTKPVVKTLGLNW